MTWLAQRSIYRDGVDLVYVERWGEKMSVAQPVNFTMVDQDARALIAAPTLTIHGSGGQELMQALWDAGLRPNDGAGSGAEAAALRKHIDFAEHVAKELVRRLPQVSAGDRLRFTNESLRRKIASDPDDEPSAGNASAE